MENPTLLTAPAGATLDADPAPMTTVSVLSVDAWRSACGGWDWNNWHEIGRAWVTICDLSPRKLLAWARAEGYLGTGSIGRVSVIDDGYNVTICERGNGCPILAIAYGDVLS